MNRVRLGKSIISFVIGASLLTETVEKDAFHVGGTLVYFNVTIGSVMLLLTAVGYALTHSASALRAPQ